LAKQTEYLVAHKHNIVVVDDMKTTWARLPLGVNTRSSMEADANKAVEQQMALSVSAA